MTSEQIFKSFCGVAFVLLSSVASAQHPIDDLASVATTVDQKTLTFAAGKAAKFATTANGRSHQQSPLTTHRGYQYAAYYDHQRHVCIGRRKLPNGNWNVIRFDDHEINSNDAHNTVVVGICHKDGTIHLAFDHHATQLNYRVSEPGVANDPDSAKWDAGLFGDIQHSIGSITPETRVTYPRFFNAPNDNLMLYYRSGTSGNGDGCIEEYNGTKQNWTDDLGTFIARDQGVFEANGKLSQYRCPYMNDLSYAGSRLHASWVWRDRFKRTQAKNQHDLCYAHSDDDGRTWQNSGGEVIGRTGAKPIGLRSPNLIVAPIPIGTGLTNSNTQYAYPDGSIHIVVGQKPKGKREQAYQHYWRNASGKWNNETLPFFGDRPKILGDKDRNLWLVFNADQGDLRIAKGTPNADQTAWSWSGIELAIGHSVNGEPLVDFARWELEKVLSIYYQQAPKKIIKTKQSSPVDGLPTPLHVLDIRMKNEN